MKNKLPKIANMHHGQYWLLATASDTWVNVVICGPLTMWSKIMAPNEYAMLRQIVHIHSVNHCVE